MAMSIWEETPGRPWTCMEWLYLSPGLGVLPGGEGSGWASLLKLLPSVTRKIMDPTVKICPHQFFFLSSYAKPITYIKHN